MSAVTTPKGVQRRQALVDAAADLLHESGIDAVRHRAVAARAGMPLASTTYYFTSLDELVESAVVRDGERELTRMRDGVRRIEAFARGPESTADLVLDVLVGVDPEAVRERVLARCERAVASARHPGYRRAYDRIRDDTDAVVADLLRRCGRDVLPGGPARLAAAVDGVVLDELAGGDPRPRDGAREMLVPLVDITAPADVREPRDRGALERPRPAPAVVMDGSGPTAPAV